MVEIITQAATTEVVVPEHPTIVVGVVAVYRGVGQIIRPKDGTQHDKPLQNLPGEKRKVQPQEFRNYNHKIQSHPQPHHQQKQQTKKNLEYTLPNILC